MTGSNTLEIAVSGDATILVPLDLNGTEGTDLGNSDLPGRIGGGHGGHEWYSGTDPWGPGGGPSNITNSSSFNSGGKPLAGMNGNAGLPSGEEPAGGANGARGRRT